MSCVGPEDMHTYSRLDLRHQHRSLTPSNSETTGDRREDPWLERCIYQAELIMSASCALSQDVEGDRTQSVLSPMRIRSPFSLVVRITVFTAPSAFACLVRSWR